MEVAEATVRITNPLLTASFTRMSKHLIADPRCRGLYLFGSLGKETADAYSETPWGWWVEDVRHLPLKRRQELLVYFGASRQEEIEVRIREACALFSTDARAACRQWDKEYPAERERWVRRHLLIST